MLPKKILYLSTIAFLLCSCSSTPEKTEQTEPKEESVRYEISSFTDLPRVNSEYWSAALSAFKRSCSRIGHKVVWSNVCSKALQVSSNEAQSFFTDNFVPWQVSKRVIGKQTGTVYSTSVTGLMTGYYEPLLEVSNVKTSKHTTPILATPEDLIIVDLASLYPQLKGMRLRGKLAGRKLIPYDSRAKIVGRKDLDKDAIAWSDDPVAVFFLQIQGSGRLKGQNGNTIRVGYDDQNGHPYKAVGS